LSELTLESLNLALGNLEFGIGCVDIAALGPWANFVEGGSGISKLGF
jgi:hypothetical protein